MTSESLENRVNTLEAENDRLRERLAHVEAALDESDSPTFTSPGHAELVADDNGRVTIQQAIRDAITDFERAYGDSAPVDYITDDLLDQGYAKDAINETIDQLKQEGSIYMPTDGHVRVV